MTEQGHVEVEEKTAAPLELFFDLVFVFAITQVVSLIVQDLTLEGLFRGSLVLALLWWSWGTWTWTTNSIDLEPRVMRVGVLLSMVGIFVIAHAVPFAFEGKGIWIAVGYLYVKAIASGLLLSNIERDGMQHAAAVRYLPLTYLCPVALLVGALVGGEAQQWWWLAGFLLELVAAGASGQSDWEVDAGHFAERHGLIMIIALGEAIIVVGATVAELEPSRSLAVLLGVGLAGACAMWWAYFDRLEELWERALRQADEHETGKIARDIYSILHYPMILGIVLYAVALEEAFHHPNDPLEGIVPLILVAAMAMYLLSMAAAIYRAFRAVLWERMVGVVVIAFVVFGLRDLTATNIVLLTTLVLLVTMGAEYMRYRENIRHDAEERAKGNVSN